MAIPATIWLYRITHIHNMEYDLQHGLCISKSPDANPDYWQIGDSTLISYRKELAAPDPPGGTLADYIPFYLGPRSPMLFQIATGWEDIQKYAQENIIYYISSVPKIKEHGLEYFFTDGHARSSTSVPYTDDKDFEKLDWHTIYAELWKSDETDLRRKEKKQSEFLIKGHVPVSCIQYIGVYNKTAEQKVLALLTNLQLSIPVRINPSRLYYDHL
jgi:ssDNA thymidine ADP-ribosyltransferase, DarT